MTRYVIALFLCLLSLFWLGFSRVGESAFIYGPPILFSLWGASIGPEALVGGGVLADFGLQSSTHQLLLGFLASAVAAAFWRTVGGLAMLAVRTMWRQWHAKHTPLPPLT